MQSAGRRLETTGTARKAGISHIVLSFAVPTAATTRIRLGPSRHAPSHQQLSNDPRGRRCAIGDGQNVMSAGGIHHQPPVNLEIPVQIVAAPVP
jgi:hypothetical protein